MNKEQFSFVILVVVPGLLILMIATKRVHAMVRCYC